MQPVKRFSSTNPLAISRVFLPRQSPRDQQSFSTPPIPSAISRVFLPRQSPRDQQSFSTPPMQQRSQERVSYGSRMGTWKPSVLRCCLLAPYVPLRFPCSESVPNREPYDHLSWRPSCDFPDKPHATSLIPPHITIAKKVTIPFPHYKDSTPFKVNPKNCTKKAGCFYTSCTTLLI